MWQKLLTTLSTCLLVSVSMARELSPMDECLLEQLNSFTNQDQTVRDIRQSCINPLSSKPTDNLSDELSMESAINERALVTAENMPRGFRRFFAPYKENYILFGSMQNKDGSAPFSGKTLDIRFEFGMKFRAFQGDNIESTPPIYFGYSQKAWWDIAESSAPFREHNYNPEVFWDFREADALGKTENTFLFDRVGDLVDRVGIEHQSNGLAGAVSRSWDRVYAQRTFSTESNDWSLRLKAWNVINLGVENANITDFLGNLEAKLSYRPHQDFEINATVLKGHHTSKYSYRLDLISSPWNLSNSKFMLSYYDGYGEALISYNQKTTSLRAGFFIPIEL